MNPKKEISLSVAVVWLAARATRVEASGRPLLKSDRRGRFAVSGGDEAPKISYAALDGARLEIPASGRLKSVVAGPKTGVKWEFGTGMVEIELPAGEGTIEIIF